VTGHSSSGVKAQMVGYVPLSPAEWFTGGSLLAHQAAYSSKLRRLPLFILLLLPNGLDQNRDHSVKVAFMHHEA
jgi:hypothetical protein